ncbi:MAG TPA: hypothetical protein ENG54_03320 [Thermofilum sp.]|nr:hypothetical protein [Thermofilum sp.]
MKDRLLRYWVYFRRGHATYLAFLISFANFIAIQYRLVIENVPALASLFPRLAYFLVAFAAIYLPICIVIGWWDYKKGGVPVEKTVSTLANPWNRDITLALILLMQDKKDEAIQILSKWVEKEAREGVQQ